MSDVNPTPATATTTPKVSFVAKVKALAGKFDRKKFAIAALLTITIFIGMQFAQVKATADKALSKANDASAMAKSVDAVVVAVSDRVDTAEQGIALLAGENQAQDQKLVALDSRLTGVEKAVTDVGKTATVAVTKADTANSRLDARNKVDNQQHKKMLAFIRGANPSFPLCAKPAAEIEKLLTDKKWNIEGDIQAEFNRLTALASASAQQTATATAVKVEAVGNVATQALAAGNTAISAVKVIADQPNKLLGKSVTTNSKKTLKEIVAVYYK